MKYGLKHYRVWRFKEDEGGLDWFDNLMCFIAGVLGALFCMFGIPLLLAAFLC